MPNLIMLCGLPASGKDTYIKENLGGYKVHSSDDLRKELYGDENTQGNPNEIFQELHRRIKADLKVGHDVVYNATNINYKRRMAFLREIKDFDCYKKCVFMATPYEICVERNRTRSRVVPEDIMLKMYKSIYIPQHFEGWDNIDFVGNDIVEIGLDSLDKFEQRNSHHTLTVGRHCRKCFDIIAASVPAFPPEDELSLMYAALYHDCGKPESQVFCNAKNEPTEEAHYYGHQFVSAYKFLCSCRKKPKLVLKACQYITWHMQPYFDTEKSERKYRRLLGNDFYDNLLLLHEADKAAK